MIINILKNNALLFPEKIALEDNNQSYTYREVDTITNYLANKINQKIGKNKRILLRLTHSPDIILAVLSIIKSNNTFVPLPLDIDSEKFEHIFVSTKADLLITNIDLDFQQPREVKIMDIRNLINKRNLEFHNNYEYSEENEIYIMHTSGSTGKPKGVIINQKNLNYILNNIQIISPVNYLSTYLFSTPYTFDVSITEILGWIQGGGKVYTMPLKSIENYRVFTDKVKKYNITHFATSPSNFSTLIRILKKSEFYLLDQLKYVLICGEKFTKNIHDFYISNNFNFTLINVYGPTETTVYASYYILPRHQINDIPIGIPLLDTTFKIFDDDKKECNEGLLHISGEGVSNGYIQEEMNGNFIQINNEIYYNTGDIVKKNEHLYYFKGRTDSQVKINGVRVELGEIESNIEKFKGVDKCVVIKNYRKLYAFILSDINLDGLKEKIEQLYPSFLVPHHFVVINQFPITSNGKIDKKKLIKKYIQSDSINESDNMDFEYLDLLKEISKILDIPIYDLHSNNNILDLGLDSLNIVQLILTLENYFDIKLEYSDIYSSENLNLLIKNCLIKKENDFIIVDKNLNDIQKNKIYKKLNDYLFQDFSPVHSFPVIHTQRLQFYNKFRSTAIVKYKFDKIDNALKVLNKLFLKHQILNSRITSTDGYLAFEIKKNISSVITIDEFNNSTAVISHIENIAPEILETSRKHNGLLSIPIIITNSSETYLLLILDHAIADKSVEKILMEEISFIIQGKEIPYSISYEQYCNYVFKFNKNKYLKKNTIHNNLISFNHDIKNFNIKLIPQKKTITAIPDPKLLKSIDYILFVSYHICKEIHKISNINKIIVAVLYDGRPLKDMRYTIGSCASSKYLLFDKKYSYKDFYEKNIDVFHSTNYIDVFYRPGFLFNKNYPNFTENEVFYKEKLSDISKISFNFLGEFDDLTKQEYLNNIKDTFLELQNTSKKIYINSFINNGYIHMISTHEIF
ncbi:hypothetical protein EVU91_13210 [Macrococcoides bohemicum]|uniref:non-ribosomal peptide synthetase n=1 Tax=Macrococcoides bohemicum TaxID=1903056 RepID=UPI00105A6A9A|nr:non-ribosomal peptide synthetase [Macrococcus bohemicus]TDL33467.1 hypothetical protein EVU91_13210 [Macrococcus bohemicus]